jgi:hypothetical protein
VSNPCETYFRLSLGFSPKIEKEKMYMSNVLYASAIKSIVYAIVCTCSNISLEKS